MICFNVTSDDCSGAYHRVISNLNSRQNRRMIGKPYAVPYFGSRGVDLMNVVDIVSMRIDVGIVRDRDIASDINSAPVIKDILSRTFVLQS